MKRASGTKEHRYWDQLTRPKPWTQRRHHL